MFVLVHSDTLVVIGPFATREKADDWKARHVDRSVPNWDTCIMFEPPNES